MKGSGFHVVFIITVCLVNANHASSPDDMGTREKLRPVSSISNDPVFETGNSTSADNGAIDGDTMEQMNQLGEPKKTLRLIPLTEWSEVFTGRRISRRYQFDIPYSSLELSDVWVTVLGPGQLPRIEVHQLTENNRLKRLLPRNSMTSRAGFRMFQALSSPGRSNITVDIVLENDRGLLVSDPPNWSGIGVDLLLEYSDHDRRRSVSPPEGRCPNDDKCCCMEPITVRFGDLFSWGWFYPETYSTHQCVGGCPYEKMTELADSTAAFVQASLHQLNSSRYSSPSCAATEVSGMSVLLVVDGESPTLDVTTLDLIVNECKCA